MRGKIVWAAAAALLIPSAAQATPTDEAERSEMITVVWKMPGPFVGYDTWPQTYLPGGIPECGEGGVQVDQYKYGTPEVRAIVDALLERGILYSSDDDTRVRTPEPQYYFVELEPCDEDVSPGETPGEEEPTEPTEPPEEEPPAEEPTEPTEPPEEQPTEPGETPDEEEPVETPVAEQPVGELPGPGVPEVEVPEIAPAATRLPTAAPAVEVVWQPTFTG